MRAFAAALVVAVVVNVAAAVRDDRGIARAAGHARAASVLERRQARQLATIRRLEGTLRFFARRPRLAATPAGRRQVRFATAAIVRPGWLRAELAETRAQLAAVRLDEIRRRYAGLVSAWDQTMRCESNKDPAKGGTYWQTLATGNGFYFALQFDEGTWNSHRGEFPTAAEYVQAGHPPEPWVQALVASRLTYDGWPNCPNP